MISEPLVDLPVLVVDIPGAPVPQGSKGARVQGNRAVLFDTNAAELRPWRKTARDAAKARALLTGWATLDCPVAVTIDVWFPRPPSVKRDRMCVKPDADKIARALLDSMTDAGVWTDDSRVVDLRVRKHYAPRQPGARIRIEAL